MSTPGFWIETLRNPALYSQRQLDRAATVAWHLNRGKLVLVEPPARA